MPANKKYLTTSIWQKSAKITAGVFGGYVIAALFHMIATLLIPYHKEVLITSIFSLFLLWIILLILPYVFKNGFKVLMMYILVIIVLFSAYQFLNHKNPFL
jgi:VIT1/CCC1 family predicted Fe2+/Mn2+ transporter